MRQYDKTISQDPGPRMVSTGHVSNKGFRASAPGKPVLQVIERPRGISDGLDLASNATFTVEDHLNVSWLRRSARSLDVTR